MNFSRMKGFVVGALAVAAAWVAPAPAVAGSGCSSIVTGAVLTAAQWNACFAAKQNELGYTPVNKAGDSMTGLLTTVAPTTTTAGFRLNPGVAPTVPTNGDMWTTSSGLYVQVNGATLGPITGGTAGSFAGTSPITVSFPAGVVTYAFDFSVANVFTARQTINLNGTTTPTPITGAGLVVNPANSTVGRVQANAYGAIVSFTGVIYAGTAAAPTQVLSGTQLTGINAYAYTGSAVVGPIASFRTYAAENITATAWGTKACIATTPSTTAVLTDSFCQQNSGGVTVGSPTGGDKGAGTLNSASTIYINGTAVTAAGITALTGDVTATGPGSVAATLASAQPAVHTWALAQTFTVAPVFTDASGSRTALGLGTAAVQNIGTSGANVPLMSTANTWASGQVFVAPVLGTPASGVVTNLTGTASININGTVGATTPTTGAFTTATASGSIAIGGATPGTNALAVTGTINISSTAIFGSALQTGSTITITAGNLITSGDVRLGAGNNLYWNTRTSLVSLAAGSVQFQDTISAASVVTISWPSNNVWQFGAADAAVAVAQTTRVQSVVAGTAAANGANWTLIGSLPTGTGTSGDIIFQTGVKTGSGTTQGTATTAFTLKGETQAANFAGAITASVAGAVSAPAFSVTGAIFTGGSATTTKPLALIEPSGTTSTGWQTGGTALGVNTSGSASTCSIIDALASGVSQWRVRCDGYMAVPNANSLGNQAAANYITFNASSLVMTGSGGTLTLTGTASTFTQPVVTNSTDASASSGSGSLQVVGGASVAKRFWIPAITTSAGLQTAVLCQSSGGEMIADSVACLASSERAKEDIQPSDMGLNVVMALKPVTYRYRLTGNPRFDNAPNQRAIHAGFSAEQAATVDARLVAYDVDGNVRTVRPDAVPAALVLAMQQLQAQMKAENDNMKAANDNLRAEVEALKAAR